MKKSKKEIYDFYCPNSQCEYNKNNRGLTSNNPTEFCPRCGAEMIDRDWSS